MLHLDDAIALLAGDVDGFAFLTLRPAIWFDGPVTSSRSSTSPPRCGGRGIGAALVTAARRLVRELGSPEMHINVGEVDVDTRRFYERHGSVNIEAGVDCRMLCYIGPTG